MRRLFTLLAVFALAGCASGPAQLPVDNLSASVQTPVEDLRPANEGVRENFSLLITSDRYGYPRLAQDLTQPTGPRLFIHRLQEKYGTAPVPPTKLHHFVVYLNIRAELKSGALGAAFGGALGAVLASSSVTREGEIVHTLVDPADFAAMSGENEYKRAIYTDAELKAGTTAYVIFIETETQGQRRFTRTVSPAKPKQAGDKAPLHAGLEAAIQFHLKP